MKPRPKLTPLQRLANKVRAKLRPPPKLTVKDWADQFLYLPRATSAEPGKFRSSRFPWLPGMLDDITDPSIGEHIWMFGSQLAKTTGLIAVAGYFTHHQPSPILFKYPTQESADSFSKEKLAPTIEDTPALREVIAEARARDSDNTISFKRFPGGFIALVGANSPSELRRRSCRVVIQDEIDSDSPSSGQEGDPVALADKRALTFSDGVFVKSSSPTIKGASRIDAAFEDSDKCYFFVPCHHCQQSQHLKWEQVKWEEQDGSDAWYECEYCQSGWHDADRIRNIMRGEWRSTAPFKGKRGRHLNGIYRLIGKKRHHQTYLHEFVADYLEAKRSDETYKVWVNTFLALAYEQQGETIHHSILYNRREGYGPQLPNKVLLLAAGVDIQESPPRIEAELRGFGLGEESWGVEYVQFQGDPRQQEVWQKLDEWLLQSRVREDGTELKVHCVGVDTGRFTKQAYEFCRARQMRRIYAVKGRGGSGLPIASLPRKSGVTRVRLFTIGTDTAKHLIYGRLTLGAHGKGYYHFPEDYPESYFDGLTAEVILTKWVNGRPARVFANPQQKRNEPLDINVYILGALAISQVNLERLAKALPPREPEATEATTEVVEDGDEPAPSLVVEPVQEAQAQTVTANPPVAVAETPVRRVRQPRVSGWVNKWRT